MPWRGGISGSPSHRDGKPRCRRCNPQIMRTFVGIATVRDGGGAAPNSLAGLSVADLLEGYRTGCFTPSDVIEDAIAALSATDAACNIVVTPMYEQAPAEAERASVARASRSAHTHL